MDELYLFLELTNKEKRYFKMWFSDNPAFDINSAGCIGMLLCDENMKELDGGELDYNDDTIELKDMINDCIELINLDVKIVREMTTEEIEKFEEVL